MNSARDERKRNQQDREPKFCYRLYIGVGYEADGTAIAWNGSQQTDLDAVAAGALGGFTRYHARGAWYDAARDAVISEPCIVYESICTYAQAKAFARAARSLLRQAQVMLVQGAVVVEEITEGTEPC